MNLRLPATLVALALAVAMAGASAASANPGKPIDPPDEGKPIVGQERYTPGGGFPSTRHPKLKGCSSSQGQWLRKAWRRAHYYTWRADKLTDHVRHADDRKAAWNQDFAAGDNDSPSLRRWFGSYDSERMRYVDDAVEKGLGRFRDVGNVEIKKLRCGSPRAPSADAHTDSCPSSNSGNGPPSAYHAPVGTIVTCGTFWNDANNPFLDFEERLDDSADTLIHETFHWLSVDAKYVVDYHADGAGGHKDKKYYGADAVDYLSRKKASWAIKNNDTYAFFALAAGRHERTWAGVWAAKEAAPDTGALFFDMSWEKLVRKWEELASQGQYLADVESYLRSGDRRYAAVWRIGSRNGALYRQPWSDFESTFKRLRATQNLIDVETTGTGSDRRWVGVWRGKPTRQTKDGGLLVDLSWEQLLAERERVKSYAYLGDIETYVKSGQRRFAAVFSIGTGGDALRWSGTADDFNSTKKALDPTMQLVDYERFLTDDGKPNWLSVYRPAPAGGGGVKGGMSPSSLVQRWEDSWPTSTLIDLEESSALPAQITPH